MSSEERWVRIENALQTVAERQVINEIQTEKNTAAIRDLIVISRTLIDSQRETDVRLKILTEVLDKLQISVDKLQISVDKFLKGLQKPNGNQ